MLKVVVRVVRDRAQQSLMVGVIQGVSCLVGSVRVNGVRVPVKHGRVRNWVLQVEGKVRVVSQIVKVDWLSSDVVLCDVGVGHVLVNRGHNLMHFRVVRRWLRVATKAVSRNMVQSVAIMEGANVRAFREVHSMTNSFLVV